MGEQKTALVTGAAMGMGAVKARMLAEKGWHVFAGVLPGADTSELGQHANITPVDQDVSDDESVIASAKSVESALDGRGLDLLINNAGIANIGTGVLEGASIPDGKKMFEINTWGMMRVIQAFLPMVRRAKPPGRIINFASGAVRANPPGSGIYNMSKHAVIGMTKTLRHELAPFGIQVTAIEPGAVKTHMTANSRETTKSIWKNVSDEMNQVYGPHLKKATTEILPDMIENSGNPPEYVAEQVLSLLDKDNWNTSYMVGKDVKAMAPLVKLLPERTFEKMIQKTYQIPQYKG